MKENSIEEDIKILEEFKTNGYSILLMKYGDRIKTNFKLAKAIEHILSDYKRVLKENEELNYKLHSKKIALEIYNRYIPKSKVKDKIEELKEAYEDSKDENGESQYYYPDYTIRVLEELLEKRK